MWNLKSLNPTLSNSFVAFSVSSASWHMLWIALYLSLLPSLHTILHWLLHTFLQWFALPYIVQFMSWPGHLHSSCILSQYLQLLWVTFLFPFMLSLALVCWSCYFTESNCMISFPDVSDIAFLALCNSAPLAQHTTWTLVISLATYELFL